MKLKSLFPAAMLLMATSFLVASCGKDGSQGPAGPAGAQGPAGTNGTNGTNGAKGDPGTANVIYSAWTDVSFLPDTLHTSGGGIDTIGYYANIDAPKLTQDILTSGDMHVYVNINTADDPTVVPLPYADETGVVIRYVAFLNTFQIYSNIDPSTVQDNAGVKYQQYRYVLVPGGTAARVKNAVDWSNYAAVKAYLGLKN